MEIEPCITFWDIVLIIVILAQDLAVLNTIYMYSMAAAHH